MQSTPARLGDLATFISILRTSHLVLSRATRATDTNADGPERSTSSNAISAEIRPRRGRDPGTIWSGDADPTKESQDDQRNSCPYQKPRPASEQTANRVMFVPDDRFSHVTGMRADQALPIEGTA